MIESIHHNQIHSNIYAHQSTRLEASSAYNINENGRLVTGKDSIAIESKSTLALTYSSDMQIAESEGPKYGMLQSLVANLLKEQGIDTKIQMGDTSVDIASLSQEEAQELIADDGYFGVEQTSDRIFQFAVGVAGGDSSRLDAIKEGIDKGFNEALDAFGGWLPDISYQTYDAVMEKLDTWVSESEVVA
jgi:hypothetical protein